MPNKKDSSLAFPAATCIHAPAAAAAAAARDTLSSCAMSDHEGTLDVTHSTLCFLNSERAAVQRCCTRRNDANNNEGAGTGLTTRCARPPSSSGTSCCHSQPTGSSSSPLGEGPPACPPSVEKQARRERQSRLSHGRCRNITHTPPAGTTCANNYMALARSSRARTPQAQATTTARRERADQPYTYANGSGHRRSPGVVAPHHQAQEVQARRRRERHHLDHRDF